MKAYRYRTGKYTVCRRVRALFGPEILQAVAVKRLIPAHCAVVRCYTHTPDLRPMDWDRLHAGHFNTDTISLQRI